jgi:hypothetical protein
MNEAKKPLGAAASGRRYPRQVEIARALRAAQACGLDVCGIEVSPTGTIKILGPDSQPDGQSDFDKWEAKL